MADLFQHLEPSKPFLKWAGNKYRIINRVAVALSPYLDAETRYIEPFAGSGAVLLNLPIEVAQRVYGDFNPDLVDLFGDVQKRTKRLIEEVEALFVADNNTQERFYALRQEFNQLRAGGAKGTLRKSALFIYLNRHCFNGLCRYGPNGFNVPFGRYKAPSPPVEEIKTAAGKLKGVVIHPAGDFGALLADAKDGDVVYCDPPYFPLSATAAFTNYASTDGFDYAAQERLAAAARDAALRGAIVAISNHATKECLKLYASMERRGVKVDVDNRFKVQRFISAKGDSRGTAPELIALFLPFGASN